MIPNEKVHVVVILGRVHGAEAPSSYVCQGKYEKIRITEISKCNLRIKSNKKYRRNDRISD